MLKRSNTTTRGRRKLRWRAASVLFAVVLVAPDPAYAANGDGWVDASVTPTQTGGTSDCMEMSLLISSIQGEGTYDNYGPGPLVVANTANLPYVTPEGTYEGRDQSTGLCTGTRGAMTGTINVRVHDGNTGGLMVNCSYTGRVGRGPHPYDSTQTGTFIKVEGGPDFTTPDNQPAKGECTGISIATGPTNFRACGQGDPFTGAKQNYKAKNAGLAFPWEDITCRTM